MWDSRPCGLIFQFLRVAWLLQPIFKPVLTVAVLAAIGAVAYQPSAHPLLTFTASNLLPACPRQLPPTAATWAGGKGITSGSGAGVVGTVGAAAAAVGVAVLTKGQTARRKPGRRRVAARCAETPFAAGLVHGKSAFSTITQTVFSGNGFPLLYADCCASKCGPCLTASMPREPADATRKGSRVARQAESGYKMSKAVPFLPVSPALEGYVGEEDGFDPMGISLAIDIRWLREAELKHGRVCMLATVGWIATDLGLRAPGEAFQVSTIEAHDAMVKFGAMPQMLCWLGYAELFGFLAIINMMEGKTDRKPGDFGIRLLYPTDERGQYEMQLKELRNGRLAMLAFGGIVTSAVLTGRACPFFATSVGGRGGRCPRQGAALCGGLQAPSGSKARGCRAAAQALEASGSLPFMPRPQNLKGFVGEEQEFDPLGFSETFDMRWLREAELKHGRVCMLATVGFVVQQYVTIPGMTPMPDALQAVYTAPPWATASLLFLAGCIESASYGGKLTMLDMFADSDREPGDLGLGSDEHELMLNR
mmetsp:Transcript_20070/g.58268  ORF Transcript_20070/g.58268 Transcript_20070/m.58268 type:complete len:535 (-) Transcript_20070:6-1610(-)